MDKKIRIIVAKPGLDGHDRGAKVISHGLRDAGFEVIYTGLHQTPQDIVRSVIQEDPDALLLSILSGAHNRLFPKITKLLKENDVDDILILGGGIIPETDVAFLKENGIEEIFGPGTTIDEISDYIKNHIKRRL
ncbi:MAG: methylmalonyl-CoA mutase [Candidatus Lokiarchaeota archaeon]|nr:methylmalonyl-CoA mutase [Candidatus Lokiarchaeota archaeon]